VEVEDELDEEELTELETEELLELLELLDELVLAALVEELDVVGGAWVVLDVVEVVVVEVALFESAMNPPAAIIMITITTIPTVAALLNACFTLDLVESMNGKIADDA
jgi:hypothetical protein